jgi:hypothetical protein
MKEIRLMKREVNMFIPRSLQHSGIDAITFPLDSRAGRVILPCV